MEDHVICELTNAHEHDFDDFAQRCSAWRIRSPRRRKHEAILEIIKIACYKLHERWLDKQEINLYRLLVYLRREYLSRLKAGGKRAKI